MRRGAGASAQNRTARPNGALETGLTTLIFKVSFEHSRSSVCEYHFSGQERTKKKKRRESSSRGERRDFGALFSFPPTNPRAQCNVLRVQRTGKKKGKRPAKAAGGGGGAERPLQLTADIRVSDPSIRLAFLIQRIAIPASPLILFLILRARYLRHFISGAPLCATQPDNI